MINPAEATGKTKIVKYPFSGEGQARLKANSNGHGEDWPVVYVLSGTKEAYVGETSSASQRIGNHLDNPVRLKTLDSAYIFFNDYFNKSAILDIENMLIEHMHADGKFVLQNLNEGQSKMHNYYQRAFYKDVFNDIWSQMLSKRIGLANHTALAIENSDIFKFSPYKSLTDEQYQTEQVLLSYIANSVSSGNKRTLLVHGGAGTGKSVLAISLLKYLADVLNGNVDYQDLEDLPDDIDFQGSINKTLISCKDRLQRIAFVVPVPAFRETVKRVFSKVKSLKTIDVLSPSDLAHSQPYDLVVVDEAHRLKRRQKLTNYRAFDKCSADVGLSSASTELDWVERQTKGVVVLFYDPLQTLRISDVMRRDFEALEEPGGTNVVSLFNQMRLLAGKNYIDYWESVLSNRPNPLLKPDFKKTGYDFRIYDNCAQMILDVKAKSSECGGLCRTVAGYAFPWRRKMRDKSNQKFDRDYDFEIQGQKYDWNFSRTDWATNPKADDQIGCIYTCQGYDLNVAGVILGPDITFDPIQKRIVVKPEAFLDKNSKDKNDLAKTSENIINAYLVLLTRGIRGTFVYAEDENLRKYLISLF
ncbi:MAG: hypothetical protein BWZ03_00169 [bacterium ADurb.BinA186]|nr:MAG: hypothetical protein BWZ03_00169 [bacterium ADurb.BinA186]